MPWECKMVEPDKYPKEVGDMWFGNAWQFTNEPGRYISEVAILSDEYVRERMAIRKPILVILPSKDVFCVDDAPSGKRDGWTVTGEAPNITVHPSINYIGRYHGWLQNGVLTEDCEGRQFK